MGVSAAVIELMHGGSSMMFVTRLKIAATVVAAFGLAMAGAAALATRPADTALQEPPRGRVRRSGIGHERPSRDARQVDARGGDRANLAQNTPRRLQGGTGSLPAKSSVCSRFRSDGSNDAAGPQRVVEALFQDAMRNQIDAVYKSFVDVEATQERLRLASATLERWERLLEATRTLVERRARPAADVERIRATRDLARSKRDDATTTLTRARAVLGLQINLPVVRRERLEVASPISRLRAAVLPGVDELVPLALAIRPDLAAASSGESAAADVAKARASRISDTYLLYSPYTLAGVSGIGVQGASWAMGVPLPMYNRTDGSVVRTALNLEQTQIQIASMERQVREEVAGARLTCDLCKSELARTEKGALADVARRRDSAERDYRRWRGPADCRKVGHSRGFFLSGENAKRRRADMWRSWFGISEMRSS